MASTVIPSPLLVLLTINDHHKSLGTWILEDARLYTNSITAFEGFQQINESGSITGKYP